MKKYDVIIFGGGTSGCACAYTAAKLGLKVLILEKNSFLGGSMTSALVVPAMKTSDNSINNEFFNKFYDELYKENASITYIDGNKGWFNPEVAKIILDKIMNEANVDIIFEAYIQSIKKNLSSYTVAIDNNNINSVQNNLFASIETNNIVDATGDGKILQTLNYKFLENKNFSQPINLRFIMSGVDSDSFINWLTEYDKNHEVTTSCNIDGKQYCSTAYTWDSNVDWALKPLFKEAIAEGILTESDTNYFQIFSIAGAPDSIAFNCPRILDNNLSRTEAYIKGRESILRLSHFCKKYLIGFEDAYISNIANSIGVRVSNRVKGKYIYTADDLKSGKKFENPVVISNYPIDIHSDRKDGSKLEKVFQEYQLPLESLIVDDNVFVLGRCISADFEAQAAIRIIPSCFSMGEGLAKYLVQKVKTESLQ